MRWSLVIFFTGWMAVGSACGDGGWGAGDPNTLLEDAGPRDGGHDGGDVAYECGEGPGNEIGIGAPCTKAGNECAADLSCDLDLDPQGVGVCIKLVCTTDEECGTNATCCLPDQSPLKVCLINECLPPECVTLFSGVCDPGTMTCGECRTDDDCPVSVCDLKTHRCG